MKKLNTLFFILLAVSTTLFSQINSSESPCISEKEYNLIAEEIAKNITKLNLTLDENVKRARPSFIWPIRAIDSWKDGSFYCVSANVDQNAASGQIQDWNCGTNTYDGHHGTDISIWPFNFYKLDNDIVEVVAAAPGTIVAKHDGEFDKNCNASNPNANYVVVMHADKSVAVYFHMKKNSITSKDVGATVIAGEKLGVVGSSGNSSGPHLHFEVKTDFSNSTSYIDPFYGSCNKLTDASWWINQKPYKETGVVRASVHTTDIVFPTCPGTEVLNESHVYSNPFQGEGLSPGYAKFYMFLRDEVMNLNAELKIINPDKSVFTTWTYTSTSDSKNKTMGYSKKLPTVDGKYTFVVTYNNTTSSYDFTVGDGNTTTTGIYETRNENEFLIYPNPSRGIFTIELNDFDNETIELVDALGNTIGTYKLHSGKNEITEKLGRGIYFIQRKNTNFIQKLIIE
jgi:hypothetical protein